MNIKWLIEKHIFSYENDIISAVNRSGSECIVFDDTDIIKFDFDRDIKNRFSNKDVVIFHGSFQRGIQILRYTDLTPGVFLTLDNYECYKYYPYYGKNMINHDYLFTSLKSLTINSIKNRLFNIIKTDKIFIRPSNVYKTFTGQILSKDNWDYDIDILIKSYGGLEIDQLVMISSYKDIKEENRAIICNIGGINEVIDCNTYSIDGSLVDTRLVDKGALSYVKELSNVYTPDRMFTIDIAKLGNGHYKVLEIGTFSCASLYNSDFDKIVDYANRVNFDVFNEYN